MTAEKHNQVLFKVMRDATKPEIKAAVELMFKVEVESVSTWSKRARSSASASHIGRRDHVKKAYVSLKAGPRAQLLRGGSVMACHQDQTDLAWPPWRGEGGAPASAQGQARSVVARAANAERWPQQQRPHHDSPQGRWSQAPLPDRRLQARNKDGDSGKGRTHRIRPEPHRPHRAGLLRRWRAPLHHRPAWS